MSEILVLNTDTLIAFIVGFIVVSILHKGGGKK